MKVCFALFTFIFLSSAASAQMHLKNAHFFGTDLTYSIDFEVKPWNDSTKLTFLVVTVKKTVPQDSVHEMVRNFVDHSDYFYWNLTDFYIRGNDTTIYPIRYENSTIRDTLNSFKTHIMQGLFLVDDVDPKSDSVNLILGTQWGYMLQSMTHFNDLSVTVQFNPLSEVDPEIPEATKRWYRKLRKWELDTLVNPR